MNENDKRTEVKNKLKEAITLLAVAATLIDEYRLAAILSMIGLFYCKEEELLDKLIKQGTPDVERIAINLEMQS
jgi:hypothetical protein